MNLSLMSPEEKIAEFHRVHPTMKNGKCCPYFVRYDGGVYKFEDVDDFVCGELDDAKFTEIVGDLIKRANAAI